MAAIGQVSPKDMEQSDSPKILIINPPRYNGLNVRRDERSADILPGEVSPFYQGAVLAQYLREKHRAVVDVLDANGLNLDFQAVEQWIKARSDYKHIIIKAADDTLLHDIVVGQIAKQYNLTTFLWEPILSPAAPERVLHEVNKDKQSIDYLILCEAEATFGDFLLSGSEAHGLAFIKDNEFVINQRLESERLVDLNSLPIPNFQDLPVKEYRAWFGEGPWMTLFTSRGCIGTCSYCLIGGSTVSRGYGRCIRLQSPERIFQEVSLLISKFGVKHITFWDDCFTLNRDRVVKFCDLVIENDLHFNWSCMSRADLIDEELLLLMKKAGLTRLGFGVESGSQRILDSIPKKVTVQQNMAAVKMCRRHGLWVWIFLIIGLPEENWSTVRETINFVKKSKPDYLFSGCATPFPGTAYYDQCQQYSLFDGDIFDVIAREVVATGAQPRARSKYLSEAELKRAEFLIHRAFLFSSIRVIISKIKENQDKLSLTYLWSKLKFFCLGR